MKFFEAFPTLNADSALRTMFEDTFVTKVATNTARSYMHIHMQSDHLIPKKSIYVMEDSLRKQVFKHMPVTVRIFESYSLSEQYSAANLMDSYRESILLELKERSIIEHHMFENAKCEFNGHRLSIEFEDSIIAEGKAKAISSLLKEIYEERCHIPLDIKVTYRQAGKKENRPRLHDMAAMPAVAGKERDYAAEQDVNAKDGSPKGTAKSSGRKSAAARPLKRSDNPNLVYGRDFDDEPVMLSQVDGEMGEITFRGQVIKLDTRQIRNEKTIIIFAVTDFTDTIAVKMFLPDEQVPELLESVKEGAFLKIKGVTVIDKFDGELTVGSITGIKKIPDFRVARKDNAAVKRVELHCHTKMSDMDGVSDVVSIVKRAHDWGHPAIAITDHGVVQAFPDANHYMEKLEKDDPFKVIYGVEAYLVDDLADIAVNADDRTLDDTFVIFDIETTGLSNVENRIIEIGAVKVRDGKVMEQFGTFINPGIPIPFEITKLTGITDDMVMSAPEISTALPDFLEFAKDSVLVAHNASFDVGFIEQNCRMLGLCAKYPYIDTVALSRILLPTLSRYTLSAVAKALGIGAWNHHRAVDDARVTAEIFIKLADMLREQGHAGMRDVNSLGRSNPEAIRKMPSHHAIILAKNETGRVNLYRLISSSHLTYYARHPRIPKSEFVKNREGLIIGSACEAGELYQALLEHKPDETIARLVNFYDYLEIQPIGNNRFMIESAKHEEIKSEEDIRNINRRIVKLGEDFHKPVVATCDVHFLDPEDEVYRRIVMAGQGFTDADNQAPLYLRTTEEMIEEFSYLGSSKAYEIVVENPNKIAESIEKISPVRPDKCPPVIEDSDKQLREICYNKAHAMYGDKLPRVVKERLERELKSIISNGFAVMYIIAQKLVWKSNEDGYLVGSRGSVGSSFVATMAGITEVNPLSPHYYCPSCHYSDFDSPEVKKYAGGCGWDMPDRDCPVCGRPLIKDGFDIPFETFLGFKGNKEPDIDLNFSGDYQSTAHKYTEVIFGKGQTFRAGTIGTLADKTAYGYVRNYYEERGQGKRRCEIERILKGCVGIRRSTGQHPGGIIVLPIGQDINSFTPVQHPANDMNSDIVTTHFDYHSIDHNLLKLDILGHDDPTMIKMLEELIEEDTGKPFKATGIKLDDPDVMRLFSDTAPLGIKPEDIDGCQLGCLGIPEFGTDFVIQMVMETKPKTLSDLIRISGLSHGTNVWLNNAQEYIRSGQATISTAICTRDDIMTFLINKGMDSELSFTIMESVRKGKGLKPEWEKAMADAGIPEWYMESCRKIEYMFPKAHAAAYVMMAYRIAYCKVNYPLAYYAAYFSIRANAFSYELMCHGKEKLEYYIRDYKKRSDKLTDKEKDTLKDMHMVQEMYARGYEFLPIDLYRSGARRFKITEGKLLPPFSTIDGMGDKAADAVETAAKEGVFLSKDDFRQRTKVSKSVTDLMADLGILGDLPESNQLSLFSL